MVSEFNSVAEADGLGDRAWLEREIDARGLAHVELDFRHFLGGEPFRRGSDFVAADWQARQCVQAGFVGGGFPPQTSVQFG